MNLYVEIAQESPRKRGLLVPKQDMYKYAKNGVQLYRSVYLYDQQGKDHADAHGSIKKFFGVRAIDNIMIDIDKGTDSHEYTLKKAQNILVQLKELDLMQNSHQCFYSGTGYHIAITNKVFNFPTHHELPYLVKNTMRKLFQDIDYSIYMRSGIYRAAHTINQKVGLYKVPLKDEELFRLNPQQIMDLARTPRLEFQYYELEGEGELESKIVRVPETTQALDSVTEPTKVVPCVQEMLRLGPTEGNRHNTALRIVSHFRRHGFPSEYARVALSHWNAGQLDEQHVNSIVETTYNGNYRFSCQDVIMKDHCKTRCIYFKRKDYLVDVKTAAELQSDLHTRMTTDFSGRSIEFSMMLGMPEFDATIYPGELVTIFGPTGSSKTTLAQNIALGYDFKENVIREDWQLSTLYLSLELSDWYMHRRNLQIVSNKNKEEVNNDYETIYLAHKDKLAHLAIQTVAPNLNQIRDKVREIQPAVLIVDYIDLIETPFNVRGEYEKIKYVSHQLSSMAVNNDLIIIQVSQVSREYSKNEVLDLYAGKGSGAIENASRKVIGLNGQASSKTKKVQMFKNTDGDSDWGCQLEWTPSFRLRRINE